MYSVLRIACLQIIVLFVAHCLHEKQIKSAHRISAQAFIVCCPLPASLGQAIETTIWHNSSLNSPFICITALGCAPVPFFLLFWTIRAIFLHFFSFLIAMIPAGVPRLSAPACRTSQNLRLLRGGSRLTGSVSFNPFSYQQSLHCRPLSLSALQSSRGQFPVQ